MDYSSALRYLDLFKQEGIKPRLEHTKFLLDKIGFKQTFKVIHVAGSKGKGSVCAFASSILCEAGFKTGLYISPPLQDFTERISVNKKSIPERDVALLVAEIKPFVEELEKSPLGKSTFFEIVTAIALRYFQLNKVEYAVLEVGLGGRLDATNVAASTVSVITDIELEHANYLGHTIEEIAVEKAGIVKAHGVCVTSSENPVVLKVLEAVSAERETRLIKVGLAVKYEITKSDLLGQEFNTTGLFEYKRLKIKLLGKHQVLNALTAATAVMHALKIKEAYVRKGLLKARWPGRLEVVKTNPLILLDGAHTLNSVAALKDAIKMFKYHKLYLLLGISKDKPIAKITCELAPLAAEVIATKAGIENAGDPKIIYQEARKHTKTILIQNVKEAVEYALGKAGKGDLILITGSLYVVGEARGMWFTKAEI